MPDGVSLRDAACVTVTAATVEHMLCDNAQLRSGETVLVHAGGSGIRSVAIALAKHLGAVVATTVGSEDKRGEALALGADLVINDQSEDFSRRIRTWTGRRGVDVVSSTSVERPGQDRSQRDGDHDRQRVRADRDRRGLDAMRERRAFGKLVIGMPGHSAEEA